MELALATQNERRKQASQPQIRIIDYSYLLPNRPMVPPLLSALGRILGDLVRPAAAPLAWLTGPM